MFARGSRVQAAHAAALEAGNVPSDESLGHFWSLVLKEVLVCDGMYVESFEADAGVVTLTWGSGRVGRK